MGYACVVMQVRYLGILVLPRAIRDYRMLELRLASSAASAVPAVLAVSRALAQSLQSEQMPARACDCTHVSFQVSRLAYCASEPCT